MSARMRRDRERDAPIMVRLGGPSPGWRVLLREAWITRPYSVAMAMVFIPLGLAALALGDDVSVSLSSIHAPTIARGLGFLMVTGGTLTLLGYVRRNAVLECLGMAVTVLAEAVYLVAVVVVLEVRGVFAGGMATAILFGSIQRIKTLLDMAAVAGEEAADAADAADVAEVAEIQEARGAPDER